jgi:hypothetical protein
VDVCEAGRPGRVGRVSGRMVKSETVVGALRLSGFSGAMVFSRCRRLEKHLVLMLMLAENGLQVSLSGSLAGEQK